jgi:hypothetical protein
MRRTGMLTRTIIGLLLVFGFAALRVTPAFAQDGTATITIHKATCPTGVGSAIFDECHGNGLAGVDFLVSDAEGDQVITTDGDGVASTTVVAGEVSISEDANVLANYLGAYVYCSEQNSGAVLFDTDLNGTTGVSGNIEAGDDVICDWYNITEAAAAPTATASSGSTALPSTGAGTSGGADESALLLMLGLAALTLGGVAVALRRRTAL